MIEPDRAELKRRCIEVLQQHQGPDNCITMEELFRTISGEVVIPKRANNQSRIVRDLVAQLQHEGHPVCHRSGTYGGYFMGTEKAHIEKEAKWFRSRAMTSLMRSKNLLNQTNGELLKQVALDLDAQNQEENTND